MTPIRKGTATRLGLRRHVSLADFEAVIGRHISAVKAEWDPSVVALFDAEVAAAREVFDDHWQHLDVLAARQRSRAVTLGAAFGAAFRMV